MSEKRTLEVEEGGVRRPVEDHFNSKYAPRDGEAVMVEDTPNTTLTAAQKENRIPIGGRYYKMNFDEYLRRMDLPDDSERPYAEVFDAGIGTVIASDVRKMIVILQKLPPGSPTQYSILNTFYDPFHFTRGPFLIFNVYFLEYVGGNHYNALKIKPGKEWPRRTVGGFLEEELLGQELLDMGEVLEEAVFSKNKPKKHYRKHTLRSNRKNSRNRKARKQNHTSK
jgi:hypothetical protein